MPLYDYECPKCELQFNELKPMAERKTAQCPGCEYPQAPQIMSPIGSYTIYGDNSASTPPREHVFSARDKDKKS